MAADQPPTRSRMPIGLFAVGSEMASFTLVGVGLDLAFGTMPGFTIGLTLIGAALAFFHLVRMAKRLQAKPPGPPQSGSPT